MLTDLQIDILRQERRPDGDDNGLAERPCLIYLRDLEI